MTAITDVTHMIYRIYLRKSCEILIMDKTQCDYYVIVSIFFYTIDSEGAF